jgi:flagellar protein FlbD
MIKLTRLNGKEYYLNSELVESLESTPDTVITLRDGKKHIALETPEEIVKKIIAYKRRIFDALPLINKDELED